MLALTGLRFHVFWLSLRGFDCFGSPLGDVLLWLSPGSGFIFVGIPYDASLVLTLTWIRSSLVWLSMCLGFACFIIIC